MEKVEVSLEMLVALGRLMERDREVVIERIIRGQTLQSVGEMIGVSKQRVREIERRGLSTLAVELQKVGFER